MKKTLVFLIVFTLFAACSCTVSEPYSEKAAFSETAGPSVGSQELASVEPANKRMVLDDLELEFLTSGLQFPEQRHPPRYLSSIFYHDDSIYYLERTGGVTSINQLSLSNNERSTLFSSVEEVIVSFLMLNSNEIIIYKKISDTGGFMNDELYSCFHLDIATAEQTPLHEKYHLSQTELPVESVAFDGKYVYIQQRSWHVGGVTYTIVSQEGNTSVQLDSQAQQYTIASNFIITTRSDGTMGAIVPGQEEAAPIFKPSSQIFNYWCFGSKLYFEKDGQISSFLYVVDLSQLELLYSVEYRYFDRIVPQEGSLIYESRTVYDDVERLTFSQIQISVIGSDKVRRIFPPIATDPSNGGTIQYVVAEDILYYLAWGRDIRLMALEEFESLF
jgi:hypothetical protein